MTPKEKAFNLIKMFNPHTEEHRIPIYHSKQCALIAVNEILKAVEGKYDEYWKEVKKEIEKL